MYQAGDRTGAMDPRIWPVWTGALICGPVFPVTCDVGDNLALHRAIEQCEVGDVLVVDAHGDASRYFGEVLATAAQARGISGLVVDGGVRDVSALERIGFQVFARWISMRRTAKHEPGVIGRTVVAEGVAVSTVSIIIADIDGIAVVDATLFEKTVLIADALVKREVELMGMSKLAALTLDLLGPASLKTLFVSS